MKIRLEKQNKVHQYFSILTLDESQLKIEDGKNNVLSVQSITHCCKTKEEAYQLFETHKERLMNKGFKVVDEREQAELKSGNFDNAKWHFQGDFPKELAEFQGYVHTGIFIAFLIMNDLFKGNLKTHALGMQEVKKRKITGPEFYRDYLDGVFISDFLNSDGTAFTSEYYENGLFTEDYTDILGENYESIYEVEDNWENYDLIEPIFGKRFQEFKTPI